MPSDHHGFIPASAEDLLRRRVKAELRTRMRAVRRALPASVCAEKSARIVERLWTLEPVAGARTLALFWPMEERREVDLRALGERARARGVRVAYPAIDPATREMTFRFPADPAAMEPGALGIPEPSPADPEAGPAELEAIVVPALAVDPRGQRIGYGAGFYDRALPRYASSVTTVAVAFDFQLVAEIPDEALDVPVAWVVTDARVLSCRSAA
jgi:5-formyltetrahydrofolate cyclo-ligase